jgi:hypothetical protein
MCGASRLQIDFGLFGSIETIDSPLIKSCYNLMGRDGPEPMIRPLWVAGPIWSCDKNNYP